MHRRLCTAIALLMATFWTLPGTLGVAGAAESGPPVTVSSEPAQPEPPAPPTLARLEDDDVRIAFRGSWRHYWDVRSSGYSRRYTRTAGSSALVRFTGTGVTLVAPLRRDAGIARLTLDGADAGTVSLYATQTVSSAAVWSISGLPNGTHTLRVLCTGAREAGSSGTFVCIDAFDVEGGLLAAAPASGSAVQQNDYRLFRDGGWRRRTSAAAYREAAMYTRTARDAVTIRFKGTAVTWFGRKSASHGRAEVTLDGQRVAIVGGAPGPSRERAVMWSASGLSDREHTVVIRSLGLPTSSLLSTDTIVDVDAFLVSGEPVYAPRPTPFSYPWRTYIVIDKSQFRLYWVKNGLLVKYYPVAHGKEGWSTPSRTWRIDAKYLTSPGSVYGPRKMRLFRKSGSAYAFTSYAIHGTNEEWVIGTRASHGCIRMYNRDILELFPQVPLGTMVVTRD